MDLEKIMKYKVILFTNQKFFMSFKNILLKLSYDIYIKKQHDSLTQKIETSKKSYSSKWFYIMKLIFSKTLIKDFSQIEDLDILKEDNESDIVISNLKSFEIDKLQFFYLEKLCKIKLNKLNIISLK